MVFVQCFEPPESCPVNGRRGEVGGGLCWGGCGCPVNSVPVSRSHAPPCRPNSQSVLCERHWRYDDPMLHFLHFQHSVKRLQMRFGKRDIKCYLSVRRVLVCPELQDKMRRCLYSVTVRGLCSGPAGPR